MKFRWVLFSRFVYHCDVLICQLRDMESIFWADKMVRISMKHHYCPSK